MFILVLFIIACLKGKNVSPFKYGKAVILSFGPINNEVRLGFSINYLIIYIYIY